MSGQLESAHFFREGDTVRDRNGREGVVASEWSLYAVVRWSDGSQEELDQFDPRVVVLERAE